MDKCLILEHHLIVVEAVCFRYQCIQCRCIKLILPIHNLDNTTLQWTNSQVKTAWAVKTKKGIIIKYITRAAISAIQNRIKSCIMLIWTQIHLSTRKIGQKKTSIQVTLEILLLISTKWVITKLRWVRPQAQISWMEQIWTTNNSKCRCLDQYSRTCQICQT